MEINLNDLKQDFISKSERLDQAKITLKSEFVGLDAIIDELIDLVSTWYTLNFIQDKPLIVNLWGLTGVGKTSLINRITELLNIEHSYYRFDLGEKSGSNAFHNKIGDLCDNPEDSPIIIALDEFQHARTVKGPFREEIDNDQNRKVWDLIDSGKVNYFNWNRSMWSLDFNLKKMIYLFRSSIEVENGIVTKNPELFCLEMGEKFDETKPTLFIPESFYDDIKEIAGSELKIVLDKELKELLLTKNGTESIKFLEKVIKLGQRPSIKYFTKALVFVMGNIDEAYTMSGNFSADIDADEFHKQSLKIKIPKIKSVLRARFRDEQIARLGNIHLIYPALSRKAFTKIIENELHKTLSTLKETLQINCTFDESLVKLIYKEGVYPVQGVRPIFTTIQHLLKSKLSFFIMNLVKSEKLIDRLNFSVLDEFLLCSYFEGENLIDSKKSKMVLNLENLRKSRKDELQSIVAVHESGHAILFAVLMNKIPEKVYSVSSDDDSHGFVYADLNKRIFSKNELHKYIACMLGGIAAEEIIFGRENITNGSNSDIEKATEFVFKLLKNGGFGSETVAFSTTEVSENHTYHNVQKIEEEALNILKESKKLALEFLQKEKELLIILSGYLSKNTSIGQQQLTIMVEMYAETKIDTGESKFYRDKLNTQLERLLGDNQDGKAIATILPPQLNKNTDGFVND